MRRLARFTLIPTLLGMLAGMPLPRPAFAQAYAAPPFEQRQYGLSQAELDQMLAPIALYPDALLSQLLIATTYWPEVAEAARFSLLHPQLTGDDALRVVEGWDWHPSVKSLLAFPQLLAMMGQRPDWVASLGDAFLVQQVRVMDSIQALRQRAQAAGSLQSNGLISIVQQGPVVSLLSPDPQLIYAPWYDANLVYGRWWWPRHPPIVWTAWAGSFGPRSYTHGMLPHVVGLPARFFVSAFDWRRGEARMVHPAGSFRFPHAPHVHADVTDRRASRINGHLPAPGSGFAVATAGPVGARQTVTVAAPLADGGRRHHPALQSGQTVPPAVATHPATQASSGARGPFAAPHARHPETAPPAPPQATAPSLRAVVPGPTTLTPFSGQATIATANRMERPGATPHPAPPADAHRPAHASHGIRAERPAAMQSTEATVRTHSAEATARTQSAERLATHTTGRQQPQGAQPGAAVVAAALRSGAMPPPAPVPAARAATSPAAAQARAGHHER